MKGRQLPGIEPMTPGLCSQCSATELQPPHNHQPSIQLVATVCTVPFDVIGEFKTKCQTTPNPSTFHPDSLHNDAHAPNTPTNSNELSSLRRDQQSQLRHSQAHSQTSTSKHYPVLHVHASLRALQEEQHVLQQLL